jgi:2-C-methyl-D-erythritol 4-phosphate cytidylyltransferase
LEKVYGNSLVAIHDGVRPIVDPELLEILYRTAEVRKGAYPCIPLADSLRRITGNGYSKQMDRNAFLLVQTPQVFHSRVLLHAYQTNYSPQYTDDVSVVEARRLCRPIIVPGRRENIKITTAADIIIAEAILNQMQ